MIEMTGKEYGEFQDELFAKYDAGEITAEEVCEKLDSVDSVTYADPRPLIVIPANIIRTDEEIKELYNCGGKFRSTDEVLDQF